MHFQLDIYCISKMVDKIETYNQKTIKRY